MNDYQQITRVLNTYLEGLYHSDTRLLAQAFHPQAHYVCATGGELNYLTMDQYFPMVDKRPSPHSRHEKRHDRIVAIRFAGPETAFAELECAIASRFFTDFLSLIKVDGHWSIISKVFHYTLM